MCVFVPHVLSMSGHTAALLLDHSFFSVHAGSPALFTAVLSKQGSSFRRLAVCLYRAGKWLAGK